MGWFSDMWERKRSAENVIGNDGTVNDVLLRALLANEPIDRDKAMRMLDTFGLQPKQKIKSMSKGMQEKLQLILVMCRNAKLYIFDEPLSGVDPAARDGILEIIMKNHPKDSTMLISTHLIHDVESIFDHALMIGQGKVLLNSSVDDICSSGKTLEDVFKEVFKYAWQID